MSRDNNLHLEKYNHLNPGDIFKHGSSFWLLVERYKIKGQIGFSVKSLGGSRRTRWLKAAFLRIKYKKYFKTI